MCDKRWWFTVTANFTNGDAHVWHINTLTAEQAAGKVAKYIDDNYSELEIKNITAKKED